MEEHLKFIEKVLNNGNEGVQQEEIDASMKKIRELYRIKSIQGLRFVVKTIDLEKEMKKKEEEIKEKDYEIKEQDYQIKEQVTEIKRQKKKIQKLKKNEQAYEQEKRKINNDKEKEKEALIKEKERWLNEKKMLCNIIKEKNKEINDKKAMVFKKYNSTYYIPQLGLKSQDVRNIQYN